MHFPGSRLSKPFLPSDIPGLIIWLDPNDASTLSVSGGNVITITDKAQGLIFSVPGGAAAPAESVHVRGDGVSVGAILFDDANMEALYNNTPVLAAAPFTILAVFISDDGTVIQNAWAAMDDSTNTHGFFTPLRGDSADNNCRYRIGAGGVAAIAGTAPDGFVVDEPHLLLTREAATNIHHIQLDDKGEKGHDIEAIPVGVNNIALGVRWQAAPGQYFSGKNLLFMAYDHDLSVTERALLQDYAWRKKINSLTAVGGIKNTILQILGGKCSLWLDCLDPTTMTLNASNRVSQHDDLSGNDYHVTQATESKQPTFVPGSGIRYDPAFGQFLGNVAAPVLGAALAGGHIWVVAESDDGTISQWAVSIRNVGSTQYATLGWEGAVAGDPNRFQVLGTEAVARIVDTTTGFTAGVANVAHGWSDAVDDHSVEIDEGSTGNSALAATWSVTPNQLEIGAFAGSVSPFSGTIKAVVGAKDGPSPSQIARVSANLATIA